MGCASSSPEAVKEPPAQAAKTYAAPPQSDGVAKEQPAPVLAVKEAAPEMNEPALPAAGTASSASDAACSANAQDTLLKVSALMQKFAEAKNERSTAVQILRRVLDFTVADCQGAFACVQTISDSEDATLLVAVTGSPEQYLEKNRLQRLGSKVFAAEHILSTMQYMTWSNTQQAEPTFQDWQQLVQQSSLTALHATPISVADKCIAVLTLGVDENANPGASKSVMWPSYMQLVAACMSSLVKDNSLPKFMPMVKDVHETPELDALIHKLVGHVRLILGHATNTHVWYRIALTASSGTAATIFDDLTQVPAPSSNTPRTAQLSSGSSQRMIKDVQANGGVIRSVISMKSTVMKISIHNRQQVMIPDVQKLINQSGNVSMDIFNTRLIKPPTSVLVFPLKVKQLIYGVIFCMSGVQSDFSDVSPRLRELCEVMSPHLLTTLTTGLLTQDYAVIQQAVPEAPGSQSGSQSAMSISKASDVYGIAASLGNSFSGDAFALNQSRSSTGALVTGLTEKLNHKRIKSAMDFGATSQLADLQVTNLLGEGGFAKVFRGLWRGLIVGIKVVVDDGKNEKMVMKNAHEIAILGTLSHPHVTQAYMCLTDVVVRDFNSTCLRSPHPSVLTSPAFKYLQNMEEKICHIEVIEYCDLGNLSTGLKNRVFFCDHNGKLLTQLADAAANGRPDVSLSTQEAAGAGALERGAGARINLHALLLTLIEIGSALSYLHRMGVVHCDIKPANVLLKSSNHDPRGFTVKVSDFGLSRVEDDDSSASFPFNSCGTAAYVAPEALVCNKKVNSSVDVYAFGILMWEMYTANRPYGSMKQQHLVEEVVIRGLRPKFPSHAPPAYVRLAQACWSGAPHQRPTFEETLNVLNTMLEAIKEEEMSGHVSAGSSSSTGSVEYMAVQKPETTAAAGAATGSGSGVGMGAGSASGKPAVQGGMGGPQGGKGGTGSPMSAVPQQLLQNNSFNRRSNLSSTAR